MRTFKTFLLECEINKVNEDIDDFYSLLDESLKDDALTIIKMVGVLTQPIMSGLYDQLIDFVTSKDKKQTLKEKLNMIKLRIEGIINKDAKYKDVYNRIFTPLVVKISKRIRANEDILEKFKIYMSSNDSGVVQGHELELRDFFSNALSTKEKASLKSAVDILKPIIGNNTQDKRLYDILSRLA